MAGKYSMLWVFCIALYLVTGAVAREAIVGGEKAAVDQFPYQIALLEDGKNVCGGGIIAAEYILSAAHCFLNAEGHPRTKRRFILAGTNDLFDTGKHAVIAEIDKFFVTSDYHTNHDNLLNDIAVVKLKRPLPLSHHIKLLELPENDSYAGKTATIAGFGWDWIDIEGKPVKGGNIDNSLRFLKVNVLSPGQLGYDNVIQPDRQLCAKAKQHPFMKIDTGLCFGDSGGPLVLKGNTVIGILSTGSDACVEEEISGIYTRVFHYLDFIHNATHGNHHHILTYEVHE